MDWLKNWQHNRALVCVCLLALCFEGCVVAQHSALNRQRAQEMVDKGVVFLRRADYSRAEAAFRVAIETAQSAPAYDGLACALFLKGSIREAENLYGKVISWFPGYVQAQANLALLYEVTGREALAHDLYRSVLTKDPMSYRVRNNYAALLIKSGRNSSIQQGKSYLLDAQAIAPHPIIQANLDTIGYNTKD